jgi:DNA repair protein RecN (Recombination protein N)
MIHEISIKDLGVIQSATLTLTPGFTAVTGETGAGKTMVVSALGLLLGERADSGVVRHAAERALVSGHWTVTNQAVLDRVGELGGSVDDGELVVTRSVSSEGRSRVVVGGAASPVSALGDIGSYLVAIHGQSEQLRLRSQTAQRESLDRYAGGPLKTLVDDYQVVYRRWSTAITRRDSMTRDASERLREAEELRTAVAAIDAVAPIAGEDVALKAKADRLANSEELRRAAQEAHESLSADDAEFDAVSLLENARRALERVNGHDPSIEGILAQITEASIVVREAAQSVSAYAAGLDIDGGDSEQVHERTAAINALVRAYGPTLDDVLALWSSASDRLFDLDRSDDALAALSLEIAADEVSLEDLATRITSARTEAAQRLSAAVTEELHSLSMPTAEFVVRIAPQNGVEFFAHGRDVVEMLLRPHPGGEPKPVTKTASGGELSRVMLAIEVVIASMDTVPTLVFDEVDAGVGGASAIEIGRRLAILARSAQVIVVTHLAQVAAFATNHLRIVKDTSGAITESTISRLDGDERIEEMARLLSGTPDSDNARAHAAEMLNSANQWRGEIA